MSTLIAAAQLQASAVAEESLTKAEAAITIAAARGAKLVIFPEVFMVQLPPSGIKAELAREASQPLDGPICERALGCGTPGRRLDRFWHARNRH
jgi:predicted amidohydrolase